MASNTVIFKMPLNDMTQVTGNHEILKYDGLIRLKGEGSAVILTTTLVLKKGLTVSPLE